MYDQADWVGMRRTFARQDWRWLGGSHPDDGTPQLTDFVLQAMHAHIPSKEVETRRTRRPWITERLRQAVFTKQRAAGTETHAAAASECSRVFLDEHRRYNDRK